MGYCRAASSSVSAPVTARRRTARNREAETFNSSMGIWRRPKCQSKCSVDLSENEGRVAVEIVYVLINAAMPGYVKIGRTSNVAQRLSNLDWTNIPVPFECFYAARVADARFVEGQLFEALGTIACGLGASFF